MRYRPAITTSRDGAVLARVMHDGPIVGLGARRRLCHDPACRDVGRLMYSWGWPLVNIHNRHHDTEHFFVPNDIKRRRTHDHYSSRSAGGEPAGIRA
jgi:hypothetical protein